MGIGVALALGTWPVEKPVFEKRLKLGVQFGRTESLSGSWGRSLSGGYDTLVSVSTGQRYELDSTWSESYNATLDRSRVALDAAFILRKMSSSRWSWHVGAGALLGVDHDARASVSHTVARYKQGARNSDRERTTLAEESFRLRATPFVGFFGVLGIDFRLGLTNPFWSALHHFAEGRPGMMGFSYPNMPMRWAAGANSLFGLRVDLR